MNTSHLKRVLPLLFTFIICWVPSLYPQDILWKKPYGAIQAEYLFDAQPTADCGLILAGSSLSGRTGNKMEGNIHGLDYWVWKIKSHSKS